MMHGEVNHRASAAVANLLPRAADVREGDSALIVNEVPVRLEWVGSGWLRDVQSVLTRRDDRPDVLVARRMSPAAREAITDAGLGWADETGAAEFAVDSIVVSRSGRTVRRPPAWTPSVVAVAEALLCDAKGTVAATANATGLSTGACARALRTLEDLGLLGSEASRGRNAGRWVDDPERLLDAYASEVAASGSVSQLQIGVAWRDPVGGLEEIGRRWDDAGVAWACTGTVAALILAPHLTSGRSADVYVATSTLVGLEAAAADAGLRPIEGGRLTLRPMPAAVTRRFARRIDGLRVAPWPRVYADLRVTGVRGEEAAEHLREVMRRG